MNLAEKIKIRRNELNMSQEELNALDDESISAKAKNNLLKNIVEVIYYLKNENGIELEVILK